MAEQKVEDIYIREKFVSNIKIGVTFDPLQVDFLLFYKEKS